MKRTDKDYSAIREKVQKAALMIAAGSSEKKAAWTVGLPRGSLQRYLKKGTLPDGLPIWPDEPTKQQLLDMGNEAADAAHDEHPGPAPCPQYGHPTNREPEALREARASPDQRGSDGKFLPGNTVASEYTSAARKAKQILADFSPTVAATLINVFNVLPLNRPDLVLAFAKEILDRGMGKPTQNIQIDETKISAEYQFIEAVVTSGDEQAIRTAADLASRLEVYARNNGGASFGGQMATLPPPGGTLNNLDPGRFRQISETDNLDASTARKESLS